MMEDHRKALTKMEDDYRQELPFKLFSQDHSATQELREEVQRLEVRLREVQEERSAKERG
ncbi:unnamed protein product [Coregonus sp. 'balchen']|nr:unnamed protein product [Coregonus sp. 'balchen']